MANSRLAATNQVIEYSIQASVTSVEDHGLIMNLAIGVINTIIGLSSNGKIVKLSVECSRKK